MRKRWLLVSLLFGAAMTWTFLELKVSGRHDSESSVPLVPEPLAATRESHTVANDVTAAVPSNSQVQVEAPLVDDREFDLLVDLVERAAGKDSLAVKELIWQRRRLLASPEDPEWSRKAEQLLSMDIRYRPEAQDLLLKSVQCRATLCELQVYDDSPQRPTATPRRGVNEYIKWLYNSNPPSEVASLLQVTGWRSYDFFGRKLQEIYLMRK